MMEGGTMLHDALYDGRRKNATQDSHTSVVSVLHVALQDFFACSHVCVASDAHQSVTKMT